MPTAWVEQATYRLQSGCSNQTELCGRFNILQPMRP